MAYGAPTPGSLKRKRRRQNRPALSAKIYLDSSLKGEVGVVSSDLSESLYSGYPVQLDADGSPLDLWAAVTPWTPSPNVSDANWVILPVRGLLPNEKPLPPNTIRFPASASSTATFVRVAQAVSPTKTLRQNTTVEIRIADVVPLILDTVFVSVDTDAVRRLEDVNKKYNGGFGGLPPHMSSRRSGKRSPTDTNFETLWEADERMKVLLSGALRKLPIVHTDDTVQLPLTHAVTHAPAPPARILACEPVSQGLIAASTNIVVVPASDRRPNVHGNKGLLSPRLDEDSGEEDTANEAFFSASEDNYPIKPIVTSKSSTDMSNTDDMIDSSAEESNLSDDSDDMISLAKPGMTEGPSGISSALTSATPRPFSSRVRGIGSVVNIGVQTPGSVFSNATATTAKGGQAIRSKTFRTQGLYERISVDLLHPKPADDEDDEARVYVDATMLARLGCFSGDWVRIEPAENTMLPLMSAFGHLDDSIPQHWRPVRVYTLPESLTKRQPRFPVINRHGRRDSNASLALTSSSVPTATMYLSPVLLANLKDPANISMSTMPIVKKPSLKRPVTPRVDPSSGRVPPTASEVTLRKIVTPISTERSLNNTLYANLKQYFEERQRIVKPGDMIAITIDGSLGRSVYEGEVEQDGSNASALLSQIGSQQDSNDHRATMNVAWFLIEDISVAPSEDLDGPDTETWGDAALIDPTKMTMRQSGDDRRRLPSTSNNPWQYYLGTRKVQAKPASSYGGPAGLLEASPPFISPLQRRLRELISVSISSRAVHLGMPPLTVLITSTQRNIGKARTVEKACADLGVHFFPIDGHDIVSEGGAGVDVQSQGLLEARCERAMDCGAQFTAICVKHIEVLNADRAAASLKGVLETCRVLVATTTDIDKVPDSVRGLFTHELEMSAPDEGEREGILRDAVTESGIATAADVDLSAIAVKTAALVAGDLVDVVDRAIVAKAERLETLAQSKSEAGSQTITIKDIQLAGGPATNSVIPGDFDAAVDMARKNFADAIGAPKIPNVQWSDVGGLTNVKDAVIETIQLPLSRPELFAKGLKKRSGILFYGPPGTGKTLLAKAIATEFSLNFFSVKGPELLNMYIGESEANVRRVFQRARDARPCAVFFDELDSVAPKRGNQGDSGGVMDRIVSQLLAELDGMSDGDENGGGVFVIGATNRPDLLDQALLRPGRFDKMLYLGISDTHEKQATILQALTRK
jgi:peroxin-6